MAYSAVLTLSVGFTATTLSTHPAIMPANIPFAGLRRPSLSISLLLIESNERNRTPALKVVPYEYMRTIRYGQLNANYRCTYNDQC